MPRLGQRQSPTARAAIAATVAAKWRDPVWREERRAALVRGHRITAERRAATEQPANPERA